MNAGLRHFAIDAVAFDLDGTLIDTVHDLAAALNRLLGDIGLAPLPKARIRDLVGKGIANLVRRAVEERRGVSPDAAELDRLLDRYELLYSQTLGDESVLFEGVNEGLAKLREDGFRLAVVTNKPRRFIAPHLEHAGIAQHFDEVVGGDDAVAKKPDAAPLRLCAQRLAVDPTALLMVGDSINDAQAARAAGCPVLIVPYGYNEGQPVQALDCDGIVPDLVALAGRCKRLSAISA